MAKAKKLHDLGVNNESLNQDLILFSIINHDEEVVTPLVVFTIHHA